MIVTDAVFAEGADMQDFVLLTCVCLDCSASK